MKDSQKFLFLDTTIPPSSSTMAPPPEENALPLCCEQSLSELISIIRASGQDPVTQLLGYLITEDPTYLPEGTQARAIARHVGRDELLKTLIEQYIRYCPTADGHE